MARLTRLLTAAIAVTFNSFLLSKTPGSGLTHQTQITNELLLKAGIIPDVVPTVGLDADLEFEARFPSAVVDAGNSLKPDVTEKPPRVTVSCNATGRLTRVGHVPHDTLFTLLMVDPDAPSPKEPSARNFWHWGIVNAKLLEHNTGSEVMEYTKPAPPKGTHRYVLLLFRQPGAISAPKVDPDDRAKFSVTKYAIRYGLGLPVAVNWFTVKPSDT